MKTLAAVLKEALAMHEAFRRMGFAAAEIFIAPGLGASGDEVLMVLKAQGLTYAVSCGSVAESEREVVAAWVVAAAKWDDKSLSDEWRLEIWAKSLARRDLVAMIGRMFGKGFRVPIGNVGVTQ